MKRVPLDVLEDRSGRLHRGGVPFDGIAYRIEGDLVTANYRVDGGVLGGPAEEWDTTRLRVLGTAVTEVDYDERDERYPEEGAYFRGALFDGVLYAFYDDGLLRAELDYRDEDSGPSREWYESGAPFVENGRLRPDGTDEDETWDENGQSLMYSSDLWQIGHSPEGRLRALRLELGYPSDILARVNFQADFLLGCSGGGLRMK